MTLVDLPIGELIVTMAIELPYWIPIKSGDYVLKNKTKIRMLNDLWMISRGNIADDLDPLPDLIVNEEQVNDQAILENRTRGEGNYIHKRKMNTTFTRLIPDISTDGLLSAQSPTEEWVGKLNEVVFGALNENSIVDEFLDDVNLFIDLYSSIISPRNASREVRPVNFYETMIQIRIVLKTQHFRFENSTRITPDFNMVSQPHPPSLVRDHEILKEFRDTIQNYPEIEFHQLEWNKTLNCRREKRYQDALLHANLTLEALAHSYLIASGHTTRNKRKDILRNLAAWLISLDIEELKGDCQNIADLRKLRNDVVHREKILSKDDIELILTGIKSLELVRKHLLQTGAPEVLRTESKFETFLVPINIGTAVSRNIGQMVLVRFGWRKERDCYRTIIMPQQRKDDPPTSRWIFWITILGLSAIVWFAVLSFLVLPLTNITIDPIITLSLSVILGYVTRDFLKWYNKKSE